MIVIDAGVFIATVLKEPLSELAEQAIEDWINQSIEFVAPEPIMYEMIATVRKAVFQERIRPEKAKPIAEVLLSYQITLERDQALLLRGLELAHLYNRPRAYDTQYLAVAERYNCDFWTVDERLYNTLSAHLTRVHSKHYPQIERRCDDHKSRV